MPHHRLARAVSQRYVRERISTTLAGARAAEGVGFSDQVVFNFSDADRCNAATTPHDGYSGRA
jgi:hypothetical protein